jgi:hypothetical protein
MPVFKRQYRNASGEMVQSPHFTVEFAVGSEMVRRSTGVSSRSAAKALEAKWRQQLVERIKLGKAPTINPRRGCRPILRDDLEARG